jgi:hypothetical protein
MIRLEQIEGLLIDEFCFKHPHIRRERAQWYVREALGSRFIRRQVDAYIEAMLDGHNDVLDREA